MSLISKIYPILRIDSIRLKYVQFRYWRMKKKMKFITQISSGVGEMTISHNLTAFDQIPSAAFQCGGRMGLLVYPIVSLFSYFTVRKAELKILIVGCRSEDDIYWLRSFGFHNTVGLDLFSYSPKIIVGDIHKTNFENSSYDIVLLGWMLSYSKEPQVVMQECKRILKPNGIIGVGIEHDEKQEINGIKPPRENVLNSTLDIRELFTTNFNHEVIFEYNHNNDLDARCVLISRLIT
jgi:SAM-dependent methyltransferase